MHDWRMGGHHHKYHKYDKCMIGKWEMGTFTACTDLQLTVENTLSRKLSAKLAIVIFHQCPYVFKLKDFSFVCHCHILPMSLCLQIKTPSAVNWKLFAKLAIVIFHQCMSLCFQIKFSFTFMMVVCMSATGPPIDLSDSRRDSY